MYRTDVRAQTRLGSQTRVVRCLQEDYPVNLTDSCECVAWRRVSTQPWELNWVIGKYELDGL